MSGVPSSLYSGRVPRLSVLKRHDRAYREYVREEQRSQPGCPAREVVLDQRGQATRIDDMRMRLLTLVALAVALFQIRFSGQSTRTVIAARTVLDGRGQTWHDTRLVIQDGRIAAIDPKAAPVTIDLGDLT